MNGCSSWRYRCWRVLARLGLAVLLAGIWPAAAQARGPRIAVSAAARANILTQLSFFKVDDLNFGRIIAGTAAGTVTVSPAGTRTATGGARLASDSSVRPAMFAGKGSAFQTVTIAMNANTRTLTRTGGTQTMTMDTFTIGSTPTALLTVLATAFTISSTSGIFTFPVGATLRVGANQAPGTYVGTFTVTLLYQ